MDSPRSFHQDLVPRASNGTTGAPPITSMRTIIVESWAQGYGTGSIIILVLILLCNYRRGVVLHKLILLELFCAIWHGFFMFFFEHQNIYGWYLSTSALVQYVSYNIHNLVAWMKIKPFLPRWGGLFFIITLAMVQPFWILEIWANYAYFNHLHGHTVFDTTRVIEPAFRDPWWIFTTIQLCIIIKKNYDLTLVRLIRVSPRFGIMLLCMAFSIIFLLTDALVTSQISSQSDGINPYWRLALVFKCASDTIFLDDFKSVLDKITRSAMRGVANLPHTLTGGTGFENYPGGGSVGTRTVVTASGGNTNKRFYKGSGTHNLDLHSSPKSSQPSSSEDEGLGVNLHRNQIGVERTVTTEHLSCAEMMDQVDIESGTLRGDLLASREKPTTAVKQPDGQDSDELDFITGYDDFAADGDEYHRVRGLERERGNSRGDVDFGLPVRPARTVSRGGPQG